MPVGGASSVHLPAAVACIFMAPSIVNKKGIQPCGETPGCPVRRSYAPRVKVVASSAVQVRTYHVVSLLSHFH